MTPHHRHLHLLLEKTPVGAYTCDSAGFITYFNRKAVDLWGREPKVNDQTDRYCGSFRLFWADGALMPHGLCWMARALKYNQEYNGQEVVIEQPNGQRIPVLAYANPIRDATNKLIGALNLLVPIKTEEGRRDSGASKSAIRILMVDHRPDGMARCANLMQGVGHDVRIVLDGLAAVRAADQFRPDVILIDTDLPKMDGYEVARLVRKQPWGYHTILVAVTNRNSPEDNDRARQAGFDHQTAAQLNTAELLPILASVTTRSER